MIPQIILAVGAVLAGLIYVAPNLGDISTGIFSTILSPFTLAVTKLFSVVGYMAPFLMAVVPIYIILSNRQEDEDMAPSLFMGMVYGLILYGIAYGTGVSNLLVQEMRGSMFVGSTLGLAVSSLGSVAHYLVSAFAAVALWGLGILLSIVGAFLDALVGLGDAAEMGRKPVNNARAGILDRLLGRGN